MLHARNEAKSKNASIVSRHTSIPDGWEETNLGSIITFQRGHDLTSRERKLGTIPVIGANGIAAYHDEAKMKGPGVAIGRSGTLGKVYYIEGDYWPLNTCLYVKEFRSVYPKFIFYFLHTIDYRKYNAGSTVPTMNRNFLHPVRVVIPKSIDEQRKIASILSKVDDLIQKTTEIIKQTQRLKQAMVKKLIFKGIGHASLKRANFGFWFIHEELADEWNVFSLLDVSENGLQNGIFKTSEYFGKGTPLVNVSDLFQETDIAVDSLERLQVNKRELEDFGISQGDIFFCRSSLALEGIGRVNIVSHLTEPAVFECHVMALRPNKARIEPKFLAYYLRSHTARKFIFSIAMTLTMTTIRQPDLEKLPVPVPPLAEQRKIVSILTSIDEYIEMLVNNNSHLIQLKKGLMQKLLTGQIRVNV